MLAVDRTSRAVLACAALIAFAGTMSTVQTKARPAAAPATIAVTTYRQARPARFLLVVPHRDPFVGGMRTPAEPAAHPAVTQPLVTIPPALGPLPPNAGARDGPFPLLPAEHVTAVVTGAHPVALVDDGSTTHLVTVGDRYHDERIVAIDPGGVHLESGTTVPVTQRPLFPQVNAGGQKS
jgi:hypothetical protein